MHTSSDFQFFTFPRTSLPCRPVWNPRCVERRGTDSGGRKELLSPVRQYSQAGRGGCARLKQEVFLVEPGKGLGCLPGERFSV